MAKSPAFTRIKTDVLAIVGTIPPGRVLTHAAIGRHLDVMARHVAYILATLGPDDPAVPAHRVVSRDGEPRPDRGPGPAQAERLAAEGVAFDGGRVRLAAHEVAVDSLPHGVPPQRR